MNRTRKILLALTVFAAGSSMVLPAADNDTGVLHLRFTNSANHLAILPNTIRVDGQATNDFKSDHHGLIEMHLPNGNHTIQAESPRFDMVQTKVVVNGNASPVVEIELQPLHLAAEPDISPAHTVVEGTVYNFKTGQPIHEARVTILGTARTSSTTEKGHYEMELPVPEKKGPSSIIDLQVYHTGFRTQTYKNLKVVPGSRRMVPVALDPVTTGSESANPKTTDEKKSDQPKRNYQWTFDVSVD